MVVTVRSVNHRFLDLQLRIPPSLAAVESRLRALVQQHVAPRPRRGVGHVQQRRAPTLEVELNEAFLAALGGALDQARERGHITGAMTPGDLLRFPQALSIRETADGARTAPPAADRGAGRTGGRRRRSTSSTRCASREGGYCAPTWTRGARCSASCSSGRQSPLPAGSRGCRCAWSERVRELRADALADETPSRRRLRSSSGGPTSPRRSSRFRGHLEHWRALVRRAEPCGRKLDFLLQEMNREVNTIGLQGRGPGVSETDRRR